MDTRTPRTVLMIPDKWEIVDAFRAKYHLKSTSAAVDLMLSEWHFFCQHLDHPERALAEQPK